jgi:hypothetical protein
LLGFRCWDNSVDLNLGFTGKVDFTRLSDLLGRDVEFGRSFAIVRSGSIEWADPVVACACATSSRPARK